MRTTIPVIVAFLAGLLVVVSFFFRDGTIIGDVKQEFLVWSSIIGGFTLLLGVVSIVRVNLTTIARKKSDWPYKILTLIAVFVMGIPAVLPSSWSPLLGTASGTSIYDWLFEYMQKPMMSTMFAILAFYIASAAYRAFRARSAEATLLLITAVLVMLYRVPLGEAFLNLLPGNLSEILNTYIMSGINMAVQRGIIIGAALGAASMSLRIILGIERTYLGKS
jgi:hypothetical protein